MAKSTKKNNTTKAAVKKVAVPTSVKEDVKKITSEPEKKKITAKPEPKKITAAKEPVKIAAKPEPKKIVAKEVKKIETKESSVPAKKTVVAKSKTVKTTDKAKALVKDETKKVTSKKATTVKKEAPKKVAAKKPAKKATSAKNINQYTTLSLDECISLMQKMGVHHTYADYAEILLNDADLRVVEKNIIEGNSLNATSFSYDTDGFDLDLIAVTLAKVADSVDIKAADFKEIKKDMDACVKVKLNKDEEKNAKEYLKEFKIAERLLMIGQRKNVTNSGDISVLIGSDVDVFIKHFFALAYEILPEWQYDDVKFYEDFAYAILSQYTDLYDAYQLQVLIDCADLYIKHGDFQHGDEAYGYILRDNQIKDYIYYRFVSIYEDIDMNKAKGLAYESMQYVDDRYMYYPQIIEILNK